MERNVHKTYVHLQFHSSMRVGVHASIFPIMRDFANYADPVVHIIGLMSKTWIIFEELMRQYAAGINALSSSNKVGYRNEL